MIKWADNQPKGILSNSDAIVYLDQAHYTMPSVRIVSDPWPGLLARTDSTKVMDALSIAMNQELGIAVYEYFGADDKR